jgi:hypothetical protein
MAHEGTRDEGDHHFAQSGMACVHDEVPVAGPENTVDVSPVPSMDLTALESEKQGPVRFTVRNRDLLPGMLQLLAPFARSLRSNPRSNERPVKTVPDQHPRAVSAVPSNPDTSSRGVFSHRGDIYVHSIFFLASFLCRFYGVSAP